MTTIEERLTLIEKRLDLMDSIAPTVSELGESLEKMQSTLNTLMIQNQELDVLLTALTKGGKMPNEPRN